MEHNHQLVFYVKHTSNNLLEKRSLKCGWVPVRMKVCKEVFETRQSVHTFSVKVPIYESMCVVSLFWITYKRDNNSTT
jgi:hypothetical protein